VVERLSEIRTLSISDISEDSAAKTDVKWAPERDSKYAATLVIQTEVCLLDAKCT